MKPGDRIYDTKKKQYGVIAAFDPNENIYHVLWDTKASLSTYQKHIVDTDFKVVVENSDSDDVKETNRLLRRIIKLLESKI